MKNLLVTAAWWSYAAVLGAVFSVVINGLWTIVRWS
jgi:hypothetical protein